MKGSVENLPRVAVADAVFQRPLRNLPSKVEIPPVSRVDKLLVGGQSEWVAVTFGFNSPPMELKTS
jgi:hypothetical protein